MQPNNYNYPTNTKKPYNIHDFIRNHKVLSILIAIGGFALIIAIIFLLTLNPDEDGNDNQAPEIAPIAYFEHTYLFNYSIGSTPATQLFTDLGNMLTDPEELASAPNPPTDPRDNTYTIDLIEDTFTTLQPQYTYRVDSTISDGRTYTLTARLDSDYGRYLVAILDRTDSDSAPDHIFIYTASNLPDKDSTIANLITWAKSFHLTNPTIISDLTLNPLE